MKMISDEEVSLKTQCMRCVFYLGNEMCGHKYGDKDFPTSGSPAKVLYPRVKCGAFKIVGVEDGDS